MTLHEMLAVLDSAQREHLKPESEGGHGGPLEFGCFIQALGENARALGYPLGYLRHQFETKIESLVAKGWLEEHDDQCGHRVLVLTVKGIGQLEAWNRNGCESHVGRGRPLSGHRRCAGKVLSDRPSRGGKAA